MLIIFSIRNCHSRRYIWYLHSLQTTSLKKTEIECIDNSEEVILAESSSDEAETRHSSPDIRMDVPLPDIVLCYKPVPLDAVNECVTDPMNRPASAGGANVDIGQRSGGSSRVSNISDASSLSLEIIDNKYKQVAIQELKTSINEGNKEMEIDEEDAYSEIGKKTYTQIYTSNSAEHSHKYKNSTETKTREDSVSSYESCVTYSDTQNDDNIDSTINTKRYTQIYSANNESAEPQLMCDQKDVRSGSETSYDSAPPPAPDVPPPDSSDSCRESRASSTSSTTAEPSTETETSTSLELSTQEPRSMNSNADDEKLSKEKSKESKSMWSKIRTPMVFSISTYKSRAEETSYDRKIVKTGSFKSQLKPDSENAELSSETVTDIKEISSSNTSSLPRPSHVSHTEYNKETHTLPLSYSSSIKNIPNRETNNPFKTSFKLPQRSALNKIEIESSAATRLTQPTIQVATRLTQPTIQVVVPLHSTKVDFLNNSENGTTGNISDSPINDPYHSQSATVTRGLSFNDRRAVFTSKNSEPPKVTGFKPDVAKKPIKRFPVRFLALFYCSYCHYNFF